MVYCPRVNKRNKHATLSWNLIACVVAVYAWFLDPVYAVNYYFDENGSTPGFGSPAGIYSQAGTYWNTSSSGNLAPVAFTGWNVMVFGVAASDLQGCTFTFNMDGAQMPTDGIIVNSTNVNITFQGAANLYLGNDQTWSVAKGSVFTEAQTWNNCGMNFDGTPLLLTGGGTINFMTPIGCNSGSRITENDAGAGLTVNLYPARATNTSSGGGYALVSGNLNLASGVATNVFGTGSVILSGGTLDNTSGSFMTLCDMSGYIFSGNFAYQGSSSLDLGKSNVTLSVSPVITVNSNTLAISGVINGAYNLVKSGAGTLALNGTNVYTGTTLVSNGVLQVNGSVTGAVTVSSGGVLGGTGNVNGVTLVQPGGAIDPGGPGTIGTLAVNADLAINGQLNIDLNSSGQCDKIQGSVVDISSCTLSVHPVDMTGGCDYIIASYTTLVGKFANRVNFPAGYSVSYAYNGEKMIAVILQRGTVIKVK